MTDLIELLRNRNEHVAQRAADEMERKDAAIAELVGALKIAEGFIDRHSEPWYISGQQDLAAIRAVLTKHQQPTTTKEQ